MPDRSIADLDSASTAPEGSVPARVRSPAQTAHARRISYFMLFRLAVLFAFTILAAFSSWYRERELDVSHEVMIWGALGFGYMVTLLFAWTLPRVHRLDAFAWGQTIIDIVLAAVVVELTGGVDSGFVFLYLLAILGAATMGDRRQTWATTGACAGLYVTMTLLQATGALLPTSISGEMGRLRLDELGLASGRALAGMVGVGFLSAYLNVQLSSSVRQIGSLRALNENIVRSLTSGLLTVDSDGRVLFANPTAHELLGTPGALDGRDVNSLLPGVGAHLEDSGGPHNRFELELRRADGRSLHLGLNCAPLLDAEGHFLGHVVHFQDVSELHDLSRRARRNERLAAVGGLAASVAHEVRNPLAAISGCAELLASALRENEDRKLLDVIVRESSRLEKTVSDLLSFTRPKAPERVAIDLPRAIRENVEAFRADPANARIDLSFSASGTMIAEVDPSQFSQILWNLLRNAAEAMPEGGSIEVALRRDAGRFELTIRDDGPGIPEVELDRVFEPFYSTKHKGSGFGLALVHRIVQDHDGEITASSTPGSGAAFTIRMPLQVGSVRS